MLKKLTAFLTAAVMVTSVASIPVLTSYADTNSTTEKRVMEKLDRGTVAVKTNDGVYLSCDFWVRKVLQIKHLIYTVTVKKYTQQANTMQLAIPIQKARRITSIQLCRKVRQ